MPPYLFLAVAIVVSRCIDKIKRFRNFIFGVEKVGGYFCRRSASSPGYLFADCDVSKKSKHNRVCVMVVGSVVGCHAGSSRLPHQKQESSHGEYRCFDIGLTAVGML